MAIPSRIVTATLSVNPLPSVTVTVQVPGDKSIAVWVVWTGIVFQEQVYAPVPPDPAAVAVPSFVPKQVKFVLPVIDATTVVGSLIVTEALPVQPDPSVITTV